MRLLKKIGFYLFARSFVAGDTLDDAIRVARELKQKNIYAIINILGEHVSTREEAGEFFCQYRNLISRLAAERLDGVHIAIKPSQLALEFSPYLYSRYLTVLLKQTKSCLPNSLLEIDREEHEYAKDIREISLILARDFQNLRVCCQINLNETPEEIKQFIDAGISIRLCKGTAYPGDIKKKKEIGKRYLEQALLLAEKGARPAIATHDLGIIEELRGVKNLEFQVLLGIENKKMEELATAGKEVEIYVPYGPDWYPYGKRRWKSIVKIELRNFFYRAGKFFIDGLEKSYSNGWTP